MFCVKCGKEGVTTYGGACLECFLKGRELVRLPHHVDLQMCTGCGEYLLGNEWVKMRRTEACDEAALATLEVIPEATLVSVGIKSTQQDERSYETAIQADLDIDGAYVAAEVSTNVRIKHGVCKRCSRRLGNFFVSIVQIRGSGKDFDEATKDEITARVNAYVEGQARNNRELFVSKQEDVAGGLDFKMSSNSLGKSVARILSDEYGAETKESSSLVGVHDDGADMYRVTFLVRLPGYAVGDVAIRGDVPYKISAINKSGGKIVSLLDFKEEPVRKSDLQNLRVEFRNGSFQDAAVVTRSEGELQVLHPGTYATVDVAIPAGYEAGETVPVVEWEGHLYVVP